MTISIQDWISPPELAGPLPRDVRLSGGGILFAVVACLFFFGSIPIAAAILMADHRIAQRASVMGAEGVDGLAHITNHTVSGKGGTDHNIGYTFLVNGKQYSATRTTPSAIWDRLAVGQPLPVRYARSNPSISRPTEWDEHPMGTAGALLIGGVFELIGAAFIAILLRDRKFLRDGEAKAGQVRGCSRAKGDYRVKYEYVLPDGEMQRGSGASPVRMEEGELVTILVDPEKPSRSTAYPTRMWRVTERGTGNGKSGMR